MPWSLEKYLQKYVRDNIEIIAKDLEEKRKALKEWADRNNMSLNKAMQKLVNKKKGSLVAKFNKVFFDEKKEALRFVKQVKEKHDLPMKFVDVHFSYDGSRITFAFIAEIYDEIILIVSILASAIDLKSSSPRTSLIPFTLSSNILWYLIAVGTMWLVAKSPRTLASIWIFFMYFSR